MLKKIVITVFAGAFFSCVNVQSQTPELKESLGRGAAIYEDFCMNCHMPNGKGEPNVYPPLANADYLMKKRNESIKAVKFGLSGQITVNGKIYNNTMAALGLSDNEVADVMNYVMNSWGNSVNEIVTASEVSKIEP